ncbi:MAG: HlyD family efflux transporter periplasmic adaptor subunit [Betaproteobacteria bacterium]
MAAVLLLAPPLAAAQAAAPAAPGGVAPREEAAEVPVLVVAGEETTLSSQMAGKIRRVYVGLGDAVRSGAPLIEFDCAEQVAQQQSADAEYRGARETHLSRLRLQALGAAGELEVTLAAAAAEKARSQVVLRESQTAYCTVAAPFSGKLARLNVKVAESVPAGHALLDLVNPASLRGKLFVPAAWAGWLRPGAAFEVTIKDTGRVHRARISKLNARVDGVSQQLELEARFDGAGTGLLPGMVGVASFPARAAQ